MVSYMNKIAEYLKNVEGIENILIKEDEYKNVNDKIHCKCKICGYEWDSKLYYLKDSRFCKECSKRKRLNNNSILRIERLREKILDYFSDKKYELIDIIEEKNGTNTIVFFNHNKDRYGNEYGKTRREYYSLINGTISKEEIGAKLSYSTEEWVNNAKKVHPDFLFDKTVYKNNHTSVIIGCKKHGYFSVSPKEFIKTDYECAKCKKEKKMNERGALVIEKLKEKYPIYDYSNAVYRGRHNYVEAICQIHGVFKQNVGNALNNVFCGCPKCKGKYKTIKEVSDKLESIKNTNLEEDKINKKQELFLERVKKLHPTLDFSKSIYNKTNEKVCVICHEKEEFGDEHGEFFITPHNLLSGYGCKKCSNNFMDGEYFIKKSNKIHNNKYVYDKLVYVDSRTKVCITCLEHGDFWQEPNSHLNGRGCPLCKTSHLERQIDTLLKKQLNSLYIYQYHNKDMFDRQSLDFYIPSKKIAIECQGEQHFIPNFFKKNGIEFAENHLKYVQELDLKKKKICKENGIKLIYYLESKFVKYLSKDDIYATNEKTLIRLLIDEN